MFGFNFGTPAAQQPAATAGGSLFGGQPTTTQTSSIFGATPQQPQQQQQQQQQLFGSTPLFGQAPTAQPATTAAGGGLFGSFGAAPTTVAGAFGTANKPPAFSFGGAASTSAAPTMFGSPATSVAPFGTVSSQPSTGQSLFGQQAPAVTSAPSTSGMSLFGNAFGQAPSQPINGTSFKFNPLTASDTAQKGALSTTVTTKHMVITAMKEYEGRSLEELRLEDYMANRRAAAPGSVPAAVPTGGMFGAAPNNAAKPLFGSPAQPQQQSLFGGTQAAAPATTGFSFGQQPATSTGGGLFGTNTPAASTAQATAPFSFGATQAKPTLSLPTTSAPNTGFSFGAAQPAAQPQTTGLFGAKPAATNAPFGTTATSTFGGAFGSMTQPTTTTTSTSLFGNPSTAPTAGGLFAPKPATSTPFGFGTTGSTTTSFGQAPAQGQSSLFPAASTAQPGGLFGAPTAAPAAPTGTAAPFSFGGSAFGSNAQQNTGGQPLMGGGGFGSNTGAMGAPGFGQINQTGGGMFQFPAASAPSGMPGFGGSIASAAALPSNVETAATAMMQALVHQKLLSLARCQPAYSVMFREPLSGPTDTGTSGISRLQTSDLGASANGSSYATRSMLPSTDGLGSLRTSLSVASSLPSTTMTSRPHSAGSSLFDLKPKFGSAGGTTSRLGLTWTGTQPGASVPGAARWSPSKLGPEPSAVSPRSVISPLSLAPRHSIRQLIPKRFSMTMDNSAADMSGTENGDISVNENGRIPDLTMHNPSSAVRGGLAAEHGLLGADISVVRPDGADMSFVDRVPSTGRSSSSIPSSTPLNPRPVANLGATTPRGRPDRHVPLIKIEEHQTPGTSRDADGAWNDEFADERAAAERPSSSSPESRQRSSVQRRQQLIQQSRPILRRPGYSSIPRITELTPSINENCEDAVEWLVSDFQVSREGYGSVLFHGRVNLTGLNLDHLIEIERGEIVVYPDETIKPPVGQGLNRPSTLTLDGIFPEDKSTREPTRSPEALSHYKEYLREISARLGATFVDYRPDSGSWQIKVAHFTRYGLLPTDGAVVGDTSASMNQMSTTMRQDRVNTYVVQSPANSKVSPTNTPFLRRAFDVEDVTMSENNGMADVQSFLERIERLQSKTEKSLSSDIVVRADLSKQHSLERHVKPDSSANTAASLVATATKQTSNAQARQTQTSKRFRRVQWPQTVGDVITMAPQQRQQGSRATAAVAPSTTISLENIARNCYYMRGRRCSFVPSITDVKLLYISSPVDPTGLYSIHVTSLAQTVDRNTEASLNRFVSRCIDVINKWSAGDSMASSSTSIFSALFDCTSEFGGDSSLISCARKLFSLCSALWSQNLATQRAAEIGSWINEATKQALLDWLGQYKTSAPNEVDSLVSADLLFGRRTDALRSIAASSPRLALILAQAGGNPASLTLLCQQLTTWDSAGTLRRFLASNPTAVHLLALAGNCPSLDLNPLQGDPKTVNIQLFGRESSMASGKKLGWRSALAAQLRYGPSALPTVPLADAIREFDTFQRDSPETYAPNALPPVDKSCRGLDAAAYNLLLVYAKNDVESIGEHLLQAVSAIQQSAAEGQPTTPEIGSDWAISGNGDVLAWLLLRAFAIAGCIPSSQLGGDVKDWTTAYTRVSVVTAVKLAAQSGGQSSPSLSSISKAMADSLGRSPSDVEKLLKFLTTYSNTGN